MLRKNNTKEWSKLKKQKFKEDILQKIVELKDRDPKAYWKLVNELRSSESSVQDNSVNISTGEWVEYYQQLLYEPGVPAWDKAISDRLEELEKEKCFAELDYQIKDSEIIKAIKKLKNGKAPGLDQITGEIIKDTTHSLLPTYKTIFNSILVSGQYPDVWNQGYLVSLF